MPFTRYFYFKKDTPALADWKAKASERDWQPARELGGYNPYREDAWNDELLVGDKLSETTSMVDALVKESIPRVVDEKEKEEESEGKGEGEKVGEKKEEVVVVKPLPRITEADRTNDQTRLDRKLNRTLYLCVKRANGGWGLPAGAIEGRENLRDVRDLPFLTTFSPSHPKKYQKLTDNPHPGRRAHPHPDRRRQHEHLDHRQRSRRPPHPRALLQGREARAARREDVLHARAHHGRPG
jgi:hypothetical protein